MLEDSLTVIKHKNKTIATKTSPYIPEQEQVNKLPNITKGLREEKQQKSVFPLY